MSLISVIVNIVLSVFFVQILMLDVSSLGLAFTISANVTFILLLIFLDRKVGGFDRKKLLMPWAKMFVASCITAVALYVPIKALDQLVFDTTRTVNLLLLTGIASIFGLSIYLLLVWILKVRELHTFISLFKKFSNFKKKVKTEEIIPESTPI